MNVSGGGVALPWLSPPCVAVVARCSFPIRDCDCEDFQNSIHFIVRLPIRGGDWMEFIDIIPHRFPYRPPTPRGSDRNRVHMGWFALTLYYIQEFLKTVISSQIISRFLFVCLFLFYLNRPKIFKGSVPIPASDKIIFAQICLNSAKSSCCHLSVCLLCLGSRSWVLMWHW